MENRFLLSVQLGIPSAKSVLKPYWLSNDTALKKKEKQNLENCFYWLALERIERLKEFGGQPTTKIIIPSSNHKKTLPQKISSTGY